jgi:DNA-binding CsgD family transcriptional regulator
VLRLGTPEGDVLPVLIGPLRLGWGMLPSRVATVVLFADPDRDEPLTGLAISRALGLTPTEGAVVAALAAGKTLTQYAEDADVSVNTAKTHLAAVFDKTGHGRQAAVVASVVSDPVIRLAARRKLA